VTTILAALVFMASPPVVDPGVTVVSPRHVVLAVSPGEMPSDNPENYAILSQDDPSFGQVTYPNRVFLKGLPERLVEDQGRPYPSIQKYEVILELPSPLTLGSNYQFGILDRGDDFLYVHHPDLNWSPSIKVNQVGYLPEALGRWAYVSYWLGSMPAMELTPEERRFSVFNSATGAEVLTASMQLRSPAEQRTEDAYMNNYSLANVFELNLFQLVNAGEFYIVWHGVGRSWPFRVGEDVYDDAFITVFKALYHQRCGTELVEPFTNFTRGDCPYADRIVRSEFDVIDGAVSPFGTLPNEATENPLDVVGGYHDAGDFDRRIQHMASVDALVDLFEIDPVRFARDDLGIPESGNGVPDVLDEALWGVEFFRLLQGNDGGVPSGVDAVGPYVYASSVLASYRYATAAAKLARAYKDWDEGVARDVLNSATRAFDWAEANRPMDWEHDTYWDAWAAAELLKTTGSGQYDQAFIDYMPFRDDDLIFSVPRFVGDAIIPPLLAYMSIERASAEHKEAVEVVLSNRSSYWLDSAQGMGYRTVKHPFASIILGSYTTPVYSGFLFRLYELFGGDDFVEWGTYTCDLSLGSNPAGYSWVTGLGSRSVERPLHLHSLSDAVEAPVPGITVYGPCGADSCLDNQGAISTARDAFLPQMADWPMGERFADVSFIPAFNEFTIQESIAPTLFAFGYLAQLDGGQRAGEASGMGGNGGAGDGGSDGGSTGMGGSAGGSNAAGGSMGGTGGASGAGGAAGAQPVDDDGGVSDDENNLDDGGVESGASSESGGCAAASNEQGVGLALILLLAIGALRRKRCHTGC